MSELPRLSEAYGDISSRHAKCTNCHTLYIDDLPNYGSIYCPNCMLNNSKALGFIPVLVRGVILDSNGKERIVE